ncbi:peroxisomal biogenesis factor 3, partial [Magnaporthiopsis poae ATCC 64411]
MLSATRRWLRRNRTPIAVGAGVVGAGYIAARYVLGKISDARERMSSDRIAKENLRRRFEQNQEDCTFTVLALLPTAATNILETMNTEEITYQIQQMKARPLTSSTPPSIADTTLTDDDGQSSLAGGPSPEPNPTTDGPRRKTKRQLWDELAVSSITRAYTLLYTLALLTMFTRIQLNLLGRRSYLSSVVALATGSAQAAIGLEDNDDGGPDRLSYGSDFEINRRYLTLSWWLLNRGWIDVRTRVEAAVARAFGHLSPRDDLSLEAFGALTSRVRAEVETGAGWLGFLLPPAGEEESVLRESGILDDSAAALDESAVVVPPATVAVPPALRRLVDETSDLIDSPSFSHVLKLLLDAG